MSITVAGTNGALLERRPKEAARYADTGSELQVRAMPLGRTNAALAAALAVGALPPALAIPPGAPRQVRWGWPWRR